MAFWIAVGIIALAWIIAGIVAAKSHYYDFSDTAFVAFVITLFGGLVMALIISVGAGTTGIIHEEKDATYDLRALVTEETTEENGFDAVYFLGFGYASGGGSTDVTSISYIQRAADGGNTLEKVDIDDSIIYEGSETPYVEEWITVNTVTEWWVPWHMERTVYREYRFHIPEGTILENYEVNP